MSPMSGGSMASYRAAGAFGDIDYEYPDPPTPRQRANSRPRCCLCGRFVTAERWRAWLDADDSVHTYYEGPDCAAGSGCRHEGRGGDG